MQITTFIVAHYQVRISRQEYPVPSGSKFSEAATVDCYREDGSPGPKAQLTFHFWTGGVDQSMNNSTNRDLNGNEVGHLHLPIERYALVVDLLRNESPVTALLSFDKPIANSLYTGREPAGSGDMD